ncbi:hypothetical protein DB32_005501 [Sandaracinus amylolyticus]|uniref:Uncharacterized protein n=1 Tax=Sandaracinus amylolyticus TaxID=927083 RepID=A0A0F6W689_9BACT|nr:hypothetical protein DB32_005501 [Sandaracinus amylolyticus]
MRSIISMPLSVGIAMSVTIRSTLRCASASRAVAPFEAPITVAPPDARYCEIRSRMSSWSSTTSTVRPRSGPFTEGIVTASVSWT